MFLRIRKFTIQVDPQQKQIYKSIYLQLNQIGQRRLRMANKAGLVRVLGAYYPWNKGGGSAWKGIGFFKGFNSDKDQNKHSK